MPSHAVVLILMENTVGRDRSELLPTLVQCSCHIETTRAQDSKACRRARQFYSQGDKVKSAGLAPNWSRAHSMLVPRVCMIANTRRVPGAELVQTGALPTGA